MSHIAKCDNCDVLDQPANPIFEMRAYIPLGDETNRGLWIRIPVPERWYGKHLCQGCKDDLVRARFAELCGLLAPYQPARVSGFIQDGQQSADEPLTTAERKALTVLSRRLLKA